MKNTKTFRRSFVRQQTPQDCGICCLAMILNYTGRKGESAALCRTALVPEAGLSLLELRDLAKGYGLSARCVQMDPGHLHRLSGPCILHLQSETGGHHFAVYYGARKKRSGQKYLMADPATYVHYLELTELDRCWQSKAALYFENLPPAADISARGLPPFVSFLRYFPQGMLLSIPFFHLCAACLGMMLSWVLQRGINQSLADQRSPVIFAVTALLLLVGVAQGAFIYIRQCLLTRVNQLVYGRLLALFNHRAFSGSGAPECRRGPGFIKMRLAEIQKIQHAMTLFLSILLSEGALILALFTAIFIELPDAGLLNMLYLACMLAMTLFRTPEFIYNNARIQELSGATERHISQPIQVSTGPARSPGYENGCADFYRPYVLALGKQAAKVNKISLYDGWLGTVNVMLVFSFGTVQLKMQAMNYNSFLLVVILSFFVTALTARVCSAMYIIADGIASSRYFGEELP